MVGFRFDNILKINIENETYDIDMSSKHVLEAQKELANASIELYKEPLDENDTDSIIQQQSKLDEIAIRYLKSILGEEGYQKMTKDKNLSSFDLVDVSSYICNEMKDFKESKIERYSRS